MTLTLVEMFFLYIFDCFFVNLGELLLLLLLFTIFLYSKVIFYDGTQ